jgi:hypothetical protein
MSETRDRTNGPGRPLTDAELDQVSGGNHGGIHRLKPTRGAVSSDDDPQPETIFTPKGPKTPPTSSTVGAGVVAEIIE